MLSLSDPGFLGGLGMYAEGGIVSVQEINGIVYRIHKFTSTSSFNVLHGTGEIDYLIAAGGGGGNNRQSGTGAGAGGGGAVFVSSMSVTPGSYSVSIGAGGAVNGYGTDSVFQGAPAQGGGGRGWAAGRLGGGSAGAGGWGDTQGGGGSGGPKASAGGQSGFNGGNGTGSVNGPGGSGGGARGHASGSSGGALFAAEWPNDGWNVVTGDNGTIGAGGIGYNTNALFAVNEGIGGGGRGGKYYASNVNWTSIWGGGVYNAPANRSGGGGAWPSGGGGGGSGVCYVRYRI